MRREGQYCQHHVHRNSVHKTMSSWWLARKFLDGMRMGSFRSRTLATHDGLEDIGNLGKCPQLSHSAPLLSPVANRPINKGFLRQRPSLKRVRTACGVWLIDCAWHPTYNIFVIMAPASAGQRSRAATLPAHPTTSVLSGHKGQCSSGEATAVAGAPPHWLPVERAAIMKER
jgi:hypothetical protein